MTTKFDDFKADLEALCRRHHVQIATTGHDLISVWDEDVSGRVGSEPIYLEGIIDETHGARGVRVRSLRDHS